MKKSILNLVLVSVSAFASLSALAAPAVTGRATLELTPDYGNGFASIEIREEGGKILGRDTTSHFEIINLERTQKGLNGTNGHGFVQNLICTADACSGSVGAGSVIVKLKQNSSELEGSVDFTPVHAVNDGKRIEVSADGSLDLEKVRDGYYTGRGFLNRDPMSSIQVVLRTEGSLKEIRDPALFIAYFVTPFVRK